MDFTIGYTVFNKAHLIEKIVESLSRMHGIPLIFLFDGCTDGSVEIFLKHRDALDNCRAFVNNGYDRFEICSNNFILKQFETDCCMLIQDDLILKNSEIFKLAEKVYENDPCAGLVGFKDGYEMEIADVYKNFISAPWSTSKYRDNILKKGEYCERTYVNRGPLCVPKAVISSIGYLDEGFYPLFWDDNDYSKRSSKAGFNNYIAYSEIETDISWGATRGASKIPYRAIYLSNKYKFSKKWGITLQSISKRLLLQSILKSKIMKVRKRVKELKNKVVFDEV
ncbi:MAG: hypothetical protein V8K32_00285 [Candidatus Electrothrix gigas]